MKIKHGMILAAGLGKRMLPITLKTPKPLIEIGNRNLLERSVQLLIDHGIEHIAINVHHLADKIKEFINFKNYKVKIIISHEKNSLLGTGGGIFQATKSFKEPFVVINPDTLWSKDYLDELKKLEDLYFEQKKTCLLLVKKDLSFDTSFKGDFNLDDSKVRRDNKNEYIFTGLQILDQNVFSYSKSKMFSMNSVWDHLIKNNSLRGYPSNKKFYHLNTKEIYDKILKLNITD